MVEKIDSISCLSTTQNTFLGNNNIFIPENQSSIFLERQLQAAKDKQGIIGKSWDGIKGSFGFGTSSDDCEKMIEKYKKGEVSLSEAQEEISSFDKKQDQSTELFSNIVTGVASIATTLAIAAAATTPIGWGALIAIGAGVGAATKVGIKTFDRSTNNIDGDAMDGKLLFNDAVSGAVTGATSAAPSGVGVGIAKSSLKTTLINGTKSGAICGAASGATSYTLNTLTDKNKEFELSELLKTTATSAFVSGTVGGVVGGGLYGVAGATGRLGLSSAQLSTSTQITQDSAASTSRKILNRAERDILAA